MRDIFNSFEQLWLAFYMYEKYKKIWDGEKWDGGSLKKTMQNAPGG